MNPIHGNTSYINLSLYDSSDEEGEKTEEKMRDFFMKNYNLSSVEGSRKLPEELAEISYGLWCVSNRASNRINPKVGLTPMEYDPDNIGLSPEDAYRHYGNRLSRRVRHKLALYMIKEGMITGIPLSWDGKTHKRELIDKIRERWRKEEAVLNEQKEKKLALERETRTKLKISQEQEKSRQRIAIVIGTIALGYLFHKKFQQLYNRKKS